jgi:hypothetical protein
MTVRNTSAEAYGSLMGAASDREIIAQLVRQRGPMTRREIASFLHMETSSVAGRVNELMNQEPPVLLELDDQRPCPITKRRVNWVAHSEQMPGMQMGLAI